MIWGSGGSKSRLAKAAGCGDIWGDERWKVARRCGAKPISKWKGTKHLRIGPLLEVEMSKKCTPLWREAHLEVKMYKTLGVRTTFGKSARRCGAKHIWKSKCTKHTRSGPTFGSSDLEKVHTVVVRSTFRSQNVKSTMGSDHFGRFRCRFASLHYTTLHYTPLHYITLHYTPLHYNYNYNYTTTLHYTYVHLYSLF